MWTGSPLFPESASTMAPRVDALYFFLVAVTTFFSLLIAATYDRTKFGMLPLGKGSAAVGAADLQVRR